MALPAMAIAGLVSGGTKIIGSLIGGGKRRREARQAAAELEARKQSFQDFSFTNPFANLENVAEDLTINQQAAQFEAQQRDAALAQSMQAAIVSGGAAGGAQAIAQAALQSRMGVSADIAKQEQMNERARIQEASRLQGLEAQGFEDLQSQQFLQQGELLNMASGRKLAADQARARSTKLLMGGVGELGMGLGQALKND